MKALVYVLPLALALYALIDLSRSEPAERAGIPSFAWVLIIVALPVIGPIVWIVISRTQGTQGGAQRASATRPTPGRPFPLRRSGPKAPDDDPDFLWRLDQQRRREHGPNAAPPDDGTPGT